MQMQTFTHHSTSVPGASPLESMVSGGGHSVQGGFASVLEQAQASAVTQTVASGWLTQAPLAVAARPDVKTFMDRTGLEFLDAAELVYGVVGANTDIRDWSVIMRSADPVAAVRAATAAMYGLSQPVAMQAPSSIAADSAAQPQTLEQAGHFALTRSSVQSDEDTDPRLSLVSLSGEVLRDAGSTTHELARNAWLFGFDTEPLAVLAEKAVDAPASLRAVMHSVAISGAQPAPVVSEFMVGMQQVLDDWIGRSLSSAGFVDARQYLMSVMGPPRS